jgi:hypothetical protein
MTTPPPSRQRLQELRAIPERQRTDAEWDELHILELEFMNNPHNSPPKQHQHRPAMQQPGGGQPGGGQPGKGPGQGHPQGKKRPFHKGKRKPPRP